MTDRRVALLHRGGSYANPCIARRLARSGFDLVVHAPRDGMVGELEELGAAVEVIGEDELPIDQRPGSDGTPEGAQLLVDRALGRFGRIDSASLLPPYYFSIRGTLMEAPPEHLVAMGSFLETTAYLLRSVIPAMQERGGQILVFTSDSGARPEAGWCLYGAGRAGQNFLVRAVALEHAKDDICINAMGSKNAVTAGFPFAPPDAATDSSITLGDWAEPLLDETPLPRLGTMEELAAFAVNLLDGTNRFQTAQYFSFSGGWNSL